MKYSYKKVLENFNKQKNVRGIIGPLSVYRSPLLDTFLGQVPNWKCKKIMFSVSGLAVPHVSVR